MSLFEDMPALSPVQFFGLSSDCLYLKGSIKPEKSHLLPSAADLLDEEVFADVYAGWNVDKLSFYVAVHQPFQKVGEGDFRRGDSIELFIDTRDLKTKGVISRSCHHFVFFPIQVQNFYGREITRFRNEDMHRLCHPEDLHTAADLDSDSYRLLIEIPAHCLHGYDPLGFQKLGFTYRINRFGAAPQHFAVSSDEYTIEQHPATWGTLKLTKE
ncbi:MAG: hypothetical protein A3E80_01225 [Chlamydiae bacterium RIFCSPHIGHO2_12_FULL_49_9]|nr:MAG: hypothetical protein A3E80_01225 [Chlamydiae bacterium RIFCSPHIGHO2_12_FULL_49_9]